MVTKRRSTRARRRITNGDISQIVADNHAETVERLARIEATIGGLPARVEKLEAKSNWLTGALAVISILYTSTIGFIFKHI